MKRLTKEDFVDRAKIVHGNKYGYSLIEYFNNYTKVKIICSVHGEFEQTPDGHLGGRNCPKCVGGVGYDTNEFINRAKIVHGDKYDYSLVNYVNSKLKVRIICAKHGEFEQLPINHLNNKQGCPKCGKIKNHINQRKTVGEFIEKANYIHNSKYDYTKIKLINNKTKIKIICSVHGEFEQTPSNHLNHKQGCPKCKTSKGEEEVQKFLNDNKIKHIRQYRFNDCKHINLLSFDFYLPDYNTCIEYNGVQHYKPVKKWGGDDDFKIRSLRDKIKLDYCNNNKINLLTIKYSENIVNKLKTLLK